MNVPSDPKFGDPKNIVFSYNNTNLIVGDVLKLVDSDNHLFYGSSIGKMFRDEIVDLVTFTVERTDMGQVFFIGRFYKNAIQLTKHEANYREGLYEDDGSQGMKEYGQNLYEEEVDYMGIRYVVGKGATPLINIWSMYNV